MSDPNGPQTLQSQEILQKMPFLVSDHHSIAIANFGFSDRCPIALRGSSNVYNICFARLCESVLGQAPSTKDPQWRESFFGYQKISPECACIEFFWSRDVPTQIAGHPGHYLSKTTEKRTLHKVFVWDIRGWGQGYPDVWVPDAPGTSCPNTLSLVFFEFLRSRSRSRLQLQSRNPVH